MNVQVLLVSVVLWMASLFGAFFYGNSLGADTEKAKQADIESVIRETRKAANLGAADAIAKIEVRTVTVQGKLRTIIKDNPVYTDCKHDAASLHLINEALTGRPGSTGDSSVPRVDAVD